MGREDGGSASRRSTKRAGGNHQSVACRNSSIRNGSIHQIGCDVRGGAKTSGPVSGKAEEIKCQVGWWFGPMRPCMSLPLERPWCRAGAEGRPGGGYTTAPDPGFAWLIHGAQGCQPALWAAVQLGRAICLNPPSLPEKESAMLLLRYACQMISRGVE